MASSAACDGADPPQSNEKWNCTTINARAHETHLRVMSVLFSVAAGTDQIHRTASSAPSSAGVIEPGEWSHTSPSAS
jgi:hypothetical protein